MPTGEYKTIIMKRIIAIFFSIITLTVFVPTDGDGAENCTPHVCPASVNKTDRITVDAYGKDLSKGCWYCEDDAAGNDACDGASDSAAIVARIDFGTGAVWDVYKCSDGFMDNDEWERVPVTKQCTGSQLNVYEEKHEKNYDCLISLDNGATFDYRQMTPKASSVENICVKCSCKLGTIPNADKTDCILDPNKKSTCEETPSYGQWNSYRSKCLCGDADRTDNKGKGQMYAQQDVSCKCETDGYVWNESQGKCVNPDQDKIDNCDNSGGNWDPTNGVCDCTNAGDGMVRSPNNLICVEDPKYKICGTSGGDWERIPDNPYEGKCNCSDKKGFVSATDGEGACVCKDDDEIYDSGADMCVTSAKAWCENTGGKWTPSDDAEDEDSDGTCDCNIDAKHITEQPDSDPVRCKCINDDYKGDRANGAPTKDGCKLTDDARNRKKAYEQYKKACEKDWGSDWSPDSYDNDRNWHNWRCNCDGTGVKNLSNLACGCDDAQGYIQSDRPPYKCILTDYETLRQNCAQTQNAEWIDNGVAYSRPTGYCKCSNSNQVYIYNTKQCIDINSGNAVLCLMIPGAKMSIDGSCICESTRQAVPLDGKCPPAASSPVPPSAKKNNSRDVANAVAVKKQIEEISKTLKGISDGFGRSRWKTASGNFNGARLASDSIAGVVLGTVGGVVTSNIIKKNQVKGGFEDINCAVGGQRVADYGDQFRVGIR